MIGILIIFCFYFASALSNPINLPCQNAYIPNNNKPYTQQITPENPLTNQATALQETLNQLLLTKILNNPSLQKIIDPNYSSNNVEIAKTGTPNVVNNYFIVPPEFFSLNDTSLVKTRKIKGKSKVNAVENIANADNAVKAKKKSKRRQKTEVNEIENVPKDRVRTKKRKKNKSATTNVDTAPNKEKIEIPNENKRKRKNGSRKRSKKPKDVAKKSEFVVEIPESAETLEIGVKGYQLVDETPKRTKSRRRNDSKRKPKLDDSIPNLDDKIIDLPQDCVERINDPTENRKTRHSKQDKRYNNQNRTHKQENNKNIAPIPDDILKSFFPYMNFYYPPNFSYDQMYPNYRRRNRKRKNNENNTIEITLKPKKSKEVDTITVAEKVVDPPTDSTQVEEKATAIAIDDTKIAKIEEKATAVASDDKIPATIANVNDISPITANSEPIKEDTVDTKTDTLAEVENTPEPAKSARIIAKVEPTEDSIPEKEISEVTETKSKSNPAELIETRNEAEQNEEIKEIAEKSEKYIELVDDIEPHEYTTTELGNEDIVPTMYNNRIISDYYPIFYDSQSYEDDREKLDPNYSQNYADAELFKSNLETDRLLKQTEAKIDDKNPFFLDTPDFKTVKLERGDKTSIYSDSKTPYFENNDKPPDIKRVLIPSKNVRPIETVYARSKVRKYGTISDETYDDTSSSTLSSEDGTYYVVAKSLGHVDDYY